LIWPCDYICLMGFTVGMCLERWETWYVKVWWLWVELRFADWCIAVMHGYSTERSESYAADTQQTATLDLKHRRRHNPTSPTYDSPGAYSPDVVALLTYSAASHVNSVTELFRISKKNVKFYCTRCSIVPMLHNVPYFHINVLQSCDVHFLVYFKHSYISQKMTKDLFVPAWYICTTRTPVYSWTPGHLHMHLLLILLLGHTHHSTM